MEGSKVDELWTDIVKAVLDITPRELITDKIKSKLREDAEELFDYDLVRDLYTPRERFCTWVPTLDEKKAHKTQYNIEHKKSDSVDATFERQLNVKVLETEAMLGNSLAQVGQTLLAALKKGTDRHPLLAFNGPDDITHTITPRANFQAEKYGPGREDYDPPKRTANSEDVRLRDLDHSHCPFTMLCTLILDALRFDTLGVFCCCRHTYQPLNFPTPAPGMCRWIIPSPSHHLTSLHSHELLCSLMSSSHQITSPNSSATSGKPLPCFVNRCALKTFNLVYNFLDLQPSTRQSLALNLGCFFCI